MTVRLNRTVGASEFLTSNKELMKLRRGSFDYACDGKVYIMKLHDNAMANNWQTYSPLHTVKTAGGMSTKGGMGGVDLLDSCWLSTVLPSEGRSGTGHCLQMPSTSRPSLPGAYIAR
ncbi:hypothetical protein T12_10967 [Trichinella patagoniensis]|uniref:Uncharacterized protein n=1 Tax=Trichinella patagoniensis TaxID=990121 RepID=A0A0V1A865_9BILA|nr:hypothetical protein T12_10967 [Trichinella patagoniensis]